LVTSNGEYASAVTLNEQLPSLVKNLVLPDSLFKKISFKTYISLFFAKLSTTGIGST
jgi:hypothetical protein